jgi:hypothetical protein
MLLTTENGDTAPIEVPEFVTAYLGSFREVGLGRRTGDIEHVWEIRGHIFRTVEDGTDVHKPCKRCGGEGKFSYNTLDGTVCYGCYGSGLGGLLSGGWDEALRLVKQREARQRAAERKMMRELHEWALAWDAWLYGADVPAGRAGLVAALLAQPKDPYSDEYAQGFLGDMARNVRYCKPLSEKQEAAAMRTLGDRAARIEAKQAAGHWGAVGQRAEVDVTILKVKGFEGDYGMRYLVTMETAEGQSLKTWASGSFGLDAKVRLHENDDQPITARIKGTVRKHDEYNGTPQTELSRVTFVN